ncbi:hypothetical protein, partial [Methylobacterium sp. Leaf117]|uniref:hypothetical protein n=1 Tax=Methylobacterium sp. Leaf117 TaxID=1736260 RepID=UPI000A49428E
MRWLAEGRVIPERVDLSLDRIALGVPWSDGNILTVSIQIIKSKIFIHIESESDIVIQDIRNVLFNIVGNIINNAGFYFVLGISYEIDSITHIGRQQTSVFGVEGFVFDDRTEFGDRLTFIPNDYGAHDLDLELAINPIIARSSFELRNAIRYPDFTALHCRLAIETIRNAFDDANETNGWNQLRSNLNINRDTIQSFSDVATTQRHGRNMPQTWEQRRRCMQIAWEICHRFRKWLAQPEPRPNLLLATF